MLMKRISATMMLMMLLNGTASAAVVRFEITSRDPFADGKDFSSAGAYERIVGRVTYAIDPKLPQNQAIVDLDKAPTNDEGLVEFTGDLFILAPADLARASGSVLYDVNNRGNKLALRFFNLAGSTNDPRSADDAGDGFLMRNGFIVVWSGWDGELLPGDHRLRLAVPIATNGTEPITGPIRCEIVPTSDVTRTVVNWANHGSYRPTEQGLRTATLTHRVRPPETRDVIPRDQWKLHVSEVDSNLPGQLPKVELELSEGLQSGHIYELIYEAQDPMVHGVCFAGLRDLISAFKHGTGRNNPLLRDGAPVTHRAHGFGVSQSGRFLREFLESGFNEDEAGRKVFDGLIPHVAGGGLGSFNHRFAQPTRHVTQHDHHDYPADRFPFAYETQTDPLTGRVAGILDKATASETAPYVMHTQSAAEYWTRSGSLPHTDPLGTRDADPPPNVRFYTFGGTQHGPAEFPPAQGAGQNLANPGDYRPNLRALLLALDRWVRDGVPAPPSLVPRIADGTLVHWNQAATGFPRIPDVRYPLVIQQPVFLDFGPRWLDEKIPDVQPPVPRGSYRVLVPRCGSDGNELGCLLPPEVCVPVATYTGWNLRNADAGAEDELVSLGGSYITFARTKAERSATGDPRESVEERYASLDQYLKQLSAACDKFCQEGYLLREDADRIVNVQRQRVKEFFK